VRLLDVLLGRSPSDERSRKGREVERLTVKSEATVALVDRALDTRQQLRSELDGAVAAFRRPR